MDTSTVSSMSAATATIGAAAQPAGKTAPVAPPPAAASDFAGKLAGLQAGAGEEGSFEAFA